MRKGDASAALGAADRVHAGAVDFFLDVGGGNDRAAVVHLDLFGTQAKALHLFEELLGIYCRARTKPDLAALQDETKRQLVDLDVVNVEEKSVFGVCAARTAEDRQGMIAITLPRAHQPLCLIPPKSTNNHICTHNSLL